MSEHRRLVVRIALLSAASLVACSPPQAPIPESSAASPSRPNVANAEQTSAPGTPEAPAAAADSLAQPLARHIDAPASGALYEIGALPPELALRLPARPVTNREQQVSTPDQFDKAAAISGTHVVIVSGMRGNLTITGSDIKVTMRDGVEVDRLLVEHSCKRIELDGGRYGSVLLALPAEFAPAERSRPEWQVEDVIIDGVQVRASGIAFEIYGKRIAIVRSKAFAGTYSIWAGPVLGLGNEDILIAGNDFHSAGPEATVRLVSATRSVTVDNTFRNSFKHNFRVHGDSSLAFAARNTMLNTGVMFGTMPADHIDKLWFDDNTFFQEAPDLFNVNSARIQFMHAEGNTAYDDHHHCFWCDPVPPGWRIERNQVLPYRKPPPERAPAP